MGLCAKAILGLLDFLLLPACVCFRPAGTGQSPWPGALRRRLVLRTYGLDSLMAFNGSHFAVPRLSEATLVVVENLLCKQATNPFLLDTLRCPAHRACWCQFVQLVGDSLNKPFPRDRHGLKTNLSWWAHDLRGRERGGTVCVTLE
jgi:hypothetical protein